MDSKKLIAYIFLIMIGLAIFVRPLSDRIVAIFLVLGVIILGLYPVICVVLVIRAVIKIIHETNGKPLQLFQFNKYTCEYCGASIDLRHTKECPCCVAGVKGFEIIKEEQGSGGDL